MRINAETMRSRVIMLYGSPFKQSTLFDLKTRKTHLRASDPLRLTVLVCLLFMIGCGQKKKTTEAAPEFFPVLAFIQSQVAHVDSSLYSIMKITTRDSLHSDTEYIRREGFRELAKEFLILPDLADPKFGKRFTEERLFDETMNRVIINYIPKDPGKEEIQKQQVLITPNSAVGDKINSIIIEKVVNNRDGYTQQNLLWRADKSFQLVTLLKKPGETETTSNIKVTWNEDKEE